MTENENSEQYDLEAAELMSIFGAIVRKSE